MGNSGNEHDLCLKAFEGLGKEIYVAESKNKTIGFVILQMEGTFKGYIQTICIMKKTGAGVRAKSFFHFVKKEF